MKSRNFWGWGYEGFELDKAVIDRFRNLLAAAFGIEQFNERQPPSLKDLELRSPRFPLPDVLKEFTTSAKFDRASHSFGKSFRDVWRGIHGRFDNPPDYIAYPRSEEEIKNILDFCSASDIAAIPFGGGSSVTGGIEPPLNSSLNGTITIDLKHLNEVLEVDHSSRTARIQGGIYGPALEKALKPHGLTLRHFPQSFEFSTLGGWIATRSGGHFATLFTHIDEFVESVRMVTPSGVMETRRLPGSGAGPSEERLLCGSEGIFGIITEAWMRVQTIPRYKATKTVAFNSWTSAVACCRNIAQSGLFPANARLVDSVEAMSNGLGDGSSPILILGFESHNHRVEFMMQEALSICKKYQGRWNNNSPSGNHRDERADNWRSAFLQAPYLRDYLIRLGCIIETFETAVTWDQFEDFHNEVLNAANQAIQEIGGGGFITCRFTHLYPDGPAPYYTVMAKGQTGNEIEQWDKIKNVVSEKIIERGGTITHHHAVGRDHQKFYKKQSTDLFKKSLISIKKELDPKGILNPGVLIESEHS